MKGEAMQSTETKETTPAPRRRVMWIGLGAVTVLAIAFGLWFGTQHGSRPKPRQRTAMSSMADMSTPSNDDSTDSTGANADLQVELGPDDLKKAQVQTVHVDVRKTSSTLRVPGIVNPNEYREVHVTSLVGGVVRQVPVVLGDHVKRGQPLAVVFSSELAEAETQYLSDLAELEADHKKLVRTQNLVKLGAASQQEEEEVAAVHAAHESHVRAALEKLKLLGASDQQIAALKQAEQIDPNFVVPAPINGVVLTRAANLGLVVNTAQELFTVADLSTVWIMASVNEKDFASVRVGTAATITAPAYLGRQWKGRVTYIQPQVDPSTRTAQARIEVANPGENLRIDMYTDVEFTSPGAPGPVVPEAAVQSIGERRFVFLPVKDNDGSFALREVRLGSAASGYYSVLEGLNVNDEVVTDGSFILKAEALRQHPELH
jgi:cobalt-zinc-cadmium efflux system membrane fusion protein